MSNKPNSDRQLKNKQASFIQHSLPGLDPGTYEVEVQLAFQQNDGSKIDNADLPSITRKFAVAGSRYTLDRNALHSVFPPAGSVGEFSDCLAHVVLNTEKLPWLRSPYTPKNRPVPKQSNYLHKGKTSPVTYDLDVPCWMAVILLSAIDLNGADLSTFVKQGVVTDLVPIFLTVSKGTGIPIPGTMAANGYSIFSYLLEGNGASGPADPGAGFSYNTTINYIDLPCSLFNAIVPSMGDLNMMAHIREVEMLNKAIENGQVVNPTEQYSIVTGNRLPESQPVPVAGSPAPVPAPGSNLALLVSLECMEAALRNHSGQTYYDTHIVSRQDGFVRVPVLYQWTFTSMDDSSFEFETILESLNGRNADSDNTTVVAYPQFRSPHQLSSTSTDPNFEVAQKMLASGYLPMNHLARIPNPENQSIRTLSWFRGPLVPMGAYIPPIDFLSTDDLDTATPTIYAADQLLRFDPGAGMYDVSYALAWELGRLLSLQNKDFSVALFQWKKRVAQQYRVFLESQVLNDMYADLIKLYQDISNIEKGNGEGHLVLQKTALRHLEKIKSSL